MAIGRGTVLGLAILLIGSCAAGPHGAVRPAPPGPFDLVRGLFGDFSGLCPENYEYCRGGRRSICCPDSRGCCEDASGPICCAHVYRDRDEEWSRGDESRGEEDRSTTTYTYKCASSDITCSQEGRTICCSRNDGCCADENGPYCCAPGSRTNYPDY
jgi:hypothetical protein